MKHKLLLCFPFLTTAFCLSSCSSFKETGKKTTVKVHKESTPSFMDEVVINNGTNAVQTQKSKSVYHAKERKSFSVAHEKITIDQLVKTSDSALANFIKSWLGVPYRYGGTSRSGIDCSAFTQTLYASVYHIDLFRTAFAQFNASIPIYDPRDLEEGDLVFFKIHSRIISHVGVYLSNGYFVQASSHGVMISSLEERYWKRYFFAGGRIEG